ncbi:glycoside hydrolase family 20 protein [Rhizophagus clarus]|uniref:Glycoside hydrolase family 20 protein n=1 Tax=Rhizophagus clarus TaxID=94130 RepID=A0A8H3MD59_9GLOM|nr:glycoside hydrolase family 20 protein [Rhizophagus clarus]
MKIDRWTLEILVNGRPLKEYEIPDPVLGISASSSLKSYVVEGRRKKFCNSAMFVAVPALGTSYNIKISPSTTSDIAARVFVDGLSDGFFTRKYWVETTHVQTSKFGGYGAISVYYYKIQHIYESPLEYNSERMFEEVKIPETKKSFDVALTTKFSSGIESHFSGPWEVVITENDPIAVLHINYRSIDWFYIKGISIENSMQVIASTSTSTDIKNEDKTSVIQTVKKNKKKKNYQEFIVILDSDDDECKREVMELD